MIAPSGDPVLIFPSSTMEGRRARALCAAAGRRCVGASSLRDDDTAADYERWVRLPLVYEADFAAAFEREILNAGIADVYAPNPLVHRQLETLAAEHGWRLTLVAPELERGRVAVTADLTARADAAAPTIPLIDSAAARPPLTALERAALLRGAASVYGQCDDTKIMLLAELARETPVGDVVEIGSAWGRSAYALFWLARRYDLGAGLSVDPWRTADAQQSDAPVSGEAGIENESIFFEYLIHMRMCFEGRVNHIRATSADALARFRRDPTVQTPTFGATRYEGRIGLLHIDGNHDYAHVRDDLDGWGALLAPGGWLVLDDYVWSYADGPKRAGDAFLDRSADQIARAFTVGVSLCVQMK